MTELGSCYVEMEKEQQKKIDELEKEIYWFNQILSGHIKRCC